MINKARVHCISTMAAARPRPSAPGLADLPDDLLVACFAQLEDPLEMYAAPTAGCGQRRGSRGAEAAPLPCCRLRRPTQLVRLSSSLRCRRRVLPLVCFR